MRNERKIKGHFFLTHFAIVIPILLTSFIATYFISYEALRQNKKMLYQQIDNFAEGFAEMYSGYNEKSILLASKPELAMEKMINNPVKTREGIDLLKTSNYFDDSLSSIFISYKTGKIYSSTGVASNDIYFRNVIGCTQESAARAENILDANKDRMTVLYQDAGYGYLLLYYAGDFKSNMSISFLVSPERLREICSQRLYGNLCYILEMGDGSRLVLESNASGTIRIVRNEEEIFQGKKHGSIQKTLNETGITIQLCYGSLFFEANRWLYVMQLVNAALIFIGISLSGILSWSLTQKRLQEIAKLERIARGDFGAMLPEKNIYSGLQHAISKGRNENQKLEESIQEHKQKLQNRIAYMIFGGLYSDSEKVMQAFRELGFLRCPESFFVGLISAQTDSFEEQLPEILKDCLRMETEYEGQKYLLFLYEIESEDEDKLRRRQVAQTIRAQLHQKEIRKVRVGMSSVFTDIVLINRAYMEAEDVLEEILSGKRKDFFLCWEEVQNQVSSIFLEETLLEKFDVAIQEQNYEDAVYCFQKLTKDTTSRECSLQNRTYLRYVILQHLIQYLQKKGTIEANIFLKECIHIDVTAEKEFVQTITNVLYQCLNRKEDDAFLKMQEFIGTHYQNSELTYEEVAAAGGISKSYISKVFRAKLNMSYIEYLTAVRMDKACTLLLTTNMNISEVAKMVGYANDSSFRRVFKECFGVSASDYRKREKE